MIPGIMSAQEAQLVEQLAAIRKAGGHNDANDPALAAEQALDRLAKKRAQTSGENLPMAYDAICKTQQGSELYTLIKQAQSGEPLPVSDLNAALAHIRALGR